MALLFEFKVHIAEYLAGLGHTDMRTLADLMAFNLAHCRAEMPFYGQELFEMADSTSGDLTDPAYLAARAEPRNARPLGHRQRAAADDLDAIVAPHMANDSPAAVAATRTWHCRSASRLQENPPACRCTARSRGTDADCARIRSRAGTERSRTAAVPRNRQRSAQRRFMRWRAGASRVHGQGAFAARSHLPMARIVVA